jgi:hypothetical protein
MDNPETLATFGTRCQFLWVVYSCLPLVLFVFVLCLVFPMLPVSLDCPFLIAPGFVCLPPVSCVPNVASFSGLSILDCPLFCLSSSCVLCTQMLPASLDCLFLISPSVFSNVYLSHFLSDDVHHIFVVHCTVCQ